jgi:hypothetical protein
LRGDAFGKCGCDGLAASRIRLLLGNNVMISFCLRRRFILAVLFGCAPLHLSATQLSATVILPSLPPGSQYQLLFVTADGRETPSDNLAIFDSFVSQEAALNPLLPATSWHAIASNTTVNALQHDVTYASIPLYNTHGQLVAHGTSDFWSVAHLAAISYDQYGVTASNSQPFTGTNPNGTSNNPFGNPDLGASRAIASSYQSADWVASPNADYSVFSGPFYGISAPITVVPEPGTLTLLCSALLVIGVIRFRRWGKQYDRIVRL